MLLTYIHHFVNSFAIDFISFFADKLQFSAILGKDQNYLMKSILSLRQYMLNRHIGCLLNNFFLCRGSKMCLFS